MKNKSILFAAALLMCIQPAFLMAQDSLSLIDKLERVTKENTLQVAKGIQQWKEYSSAEGGFSILFPGDPILETKVIDAAPDVQFNLRIHKLQGQGEYSVMYADYPIPVGDPAVAKQVLDDGAAGAVASVNAKLLELKEITLDVHPGRYLRERMPGGDIMQVKVYLVGQRLYQIAVTAPRAEAGSAEAEKQNEALADKFLGSFKLRKRE